MFVLDTNVIILYLRGSESIKVWMDRQRSMGRSLTVSVLTVTELLAYPLLSEEHRMLIEVLLREFLVIDVDMTIARAAARLRKSHKLKTIDSLIAATADVLHFPLVTKDRAFKKLGRGAVIVL